MRSTHEMWWKLAKNNIHIKINRQRKNRKCSQVLSELTTALRYYETKPAYHFKDKLLRERKCQYSDLTGII